METDESSSSFLVDLALDFLPHNSLLINWSIQEMQETLSNLDDIVYLVGLGSDCKISNVMNLAA